MVRVWEEGISYSKWQSVYYDCNILSFPWWSYIPSLVMSSIYPPPGALYYPPPGAPMTSYDVTFRAPGGGEREWTPVAVNHSSRTVTSYDVIGRQEEGREGRYIFCTCCHKSLFLLKSSTCHLRVGYVVESERKSGYAVESNTAPSTMQCTLIDNRYLINR